MLTTLLMFGRQ